MIRIQELLVPFTKISELFRMISRTWERSLKGRRKKKLSKYCDCSNFYPTNQQPPQAPLSEQLLRGLKIANQENSTRRKLNIFDEPFPQFEMLLRKGNEQAQLDVKLTCKDKKRERCWSFK